MHERNSPVEDHHNVKIHEEGEKERKGEKEEGKWRAEEV